MTDVTLTSNRTGRQTCPSRRQLDILAFIVRRVDERGFPPTIREIGRQHGIDSTSVVNFHLKRLAEFGLIIRGTRISRGVLVTAAGRREAGGSTPAEPATAPEVSIAADAVVSAAERLVDPTPEDSIGVRWESLSRAVDGLRRVRDAQPEAVPA